LLHDTRCGSAEIFTILACCTTHAVVQLRFSHFWLVARHTLWFSWDFHISGLLHDTRCGSAEIFTVLRCCTTHAVVQLRFSQFWVVARHRLVNQTHLKGSWRWDRNVVPKRR